MTVRAQEWLRADLGALPEYTPAHVPDPLQVIKLDSNENPYGPSPRVLAALANVRTWQYYYGQDDLLRALGEYVGVAPECLVVTNGGDEAIDLVLRAVLERGDAVVDSPPSFEMYRIWTLANGGRVVDVPRLPDFSLDVAGIEDAVRRHNARVIALASPGNPDGRLVSRIALLKLLALPALLMLDEAYYEYAGVNAVDLLNAHPNLVIVRTLSKWAGLAGIRVGYVIGEPTFIRALHRLRAPYNVNLAGIVAARESLNDVEWLMANVRATIVERERMRVELARWGWLEPLPSHTNFLLVRVRDREPQSVRQALAERGILVRAFRSPLLRGYIRLTIGKPEQNTAVLEALRDIERKG